MQAVAPCKILVFSSTQLDWKLLENGKVYVRIAIPSDYESKGTEGAPVPEHTLVHSLPRRRLISAESGRRVRNRSGELLLLLVLSYH